MNEARPGYVLLEDGTRFDGELCGAPADGLRRGRLHDRHERLPGVGHRPVVRGPADHLHLPAHRQLRRQQRRDGVRPRPRARGRSCAPAVNTEDAPTAERGWLDWLTDCGIPAISGVDTRALVRHIRSAGAMRGGVFAAGHAAGAARSNGSLAEPPMAGLDLARRGHAGRASSRHGEGNPGPLIAAIDTGIKLSIVRELVAARRAPRPASLHRDARTSCSPRAPTRSSWPTAPATRPRSTTSSPRSASSSGSGRRSASASGHQLLCRAVGLETFKLPFGHRGGNHPVKDLRTGPDRDHLAEPRLRGRRARRRAARRARRAGPLGDRLRRRRAEPREPLRPHGRGAHAARRRGRDRPVPPRGRARAQRQPLPLRPLPRPDEAHA